MKKEFKNLIISGVILSIMLFVGLTQKPQELGGTISYIYQGGTSTSTTPTDGQILIGRTTTKDYNLSTLTAGSNITITNASGDITIASTGGGGGGSNWEILTVNAITPTSTIGIIVNASSTIASTLNVTGTLTANGDFYATTLYGDGSNLTGIGTATASALTISAKAGENITKGQAVYISGATGQIPQVSKADNTVIDSGDVIGIAAETKTTGQTILIRVSGELTTLDTSAWSDGDKLFLSTAGSMSTTTPTSGIVLRLGSVSYAHANQGKIIVKLHRIPQTGAPADLTLFNRMGDDAGVTQIEFRNYSNTEVGYIDSLGNFVFVDGTTTDFYTTQLGINSEYFNDLTGTGLQNSSGALTLNATGDWTGTLDTYEASELIFSTTTNNYWATQTNLSAFVNDSGFITTSDWATTSARYLLSQSAGTNLTWDGTEFDVTDAWWNADGDISIDTISESKIIFSTACGPGNHYYLSGNDLACEADDDTTYTATGTLLDLTSEVFSINEGTMTTGKFCLYDGTNLVCNSEAGATLTQEQVEDYAGKMTATSTGTHTLITITYQDATNDMDFVVNNDLHAYDWNSVVDADITNTLTCSDLVAGSAVVDISTETNLATSTGISLIGDTLGLTLGEIDHDGLLNFVEAEHVDWAGAAAGTIHTDNYIEYTDAAVDTHLSGGTGIGYSSGAITFDCSEVEGVGINCSVEAITLDATGDWTGTLDGYEASELIFSTTTENYWASQSAGTNLTWDGSNFNVTDSWWNALTDMVLTDNYIYVGDASNDPVGVAMSNDCTMASNGAITCDHDALLNFEANEHLDWTTDLGAVNVHAGNYTDTNTTYTVSNPITLGGTVIGFASSSDLATAYTHSQDNTQAHSDYFLNTGTDIAGAGSGFTWTFNASAGSDPVFTFGDGIINVTTGALQVGGAAVQTGADLVDDAVASCANVNACTLTADAITDNLILLADFAHSQDYGDFTIGAGESFTLDTGVVGDNEIDYANVTLEDFDYQTAWRVFYSDTAGDVTELALGADGTYLKSNGAAVAPTWASPSGSSLFTDDGAFTYLTATSDDLVIGSSATATASLWMDISEDDLYIGSGGAGDSVVDFYADSVHKWAIGMDNSDGSDFKIATSNDFATGVAIDIDWATAAVTIPTLTISTDINLPNDVVDAADVNWGNMTDLTTGGAVVWGNIAAGELADNTVQAADIDTIACGTNCTWDATNDEIDIDDAFLKNNANDIMVGVLTADGLTLGANENITLGSQTLDHDGTDFVFNDTVTITGDSGGADDPSVPMTLYNTDAVPPAASGFPIGTLYLQYTP